MLVMSVLGFLGFLCWITDPLLIGIDWKGRMESARATFASRREE
jgi:hypothetical protein